MIQLRWRRSTKPMLQLHLPLNYHVTNVYICRTKKNRNNKKERVIVNFGVYASEQKLPLTAQEELHAI